MKLFSDIKNINKYILNPKHTVEEKYTTTQKWRILFSALLYDIIIAFVIAIPILYAIDAFIIPLETNDEFNEFSFAELFFFVVILAPILEEIMFRLPLKFSRNILMLFDSKKNSIENFWIKYFKHIFYIFSFAFALVHITNYKNTQTVFYILAPLIVFIQGFGGLIIGYIRMHLGFLWGILSHALYNFIVAIVVSLIFHNDILLEKKNDIIDLKIHELHYHNHKQKKEVNFNENTITSIHWNDETIQKLLDTLYNKQYKTFDNHLTKVKLTTTKPISKKEFLEILKEEYRIEKE